MSNHANTIIAIVEDDRNFREELAILLESHGYQVEQCMTLEGLLETLQTQNISLVTLDINLPGKNGFEIARLLRQAVPEIGIIMLSGRQEVTDRVRGYDQGADLYLKKPVNPEELLASINSVMRRVNRHADPVWQLRPTTYELMHHHPEHTISLTPIETIILRTLALAPNQMMGAGELIDVIEEKNEGREFTQRSLENIISRLRKKTAPFSAQMPHQVLIKSHRNTGYQLTIELKIQI